MYAPLLSMTCRQRSGRDRNPIIGFRVRRSPWTFDQRSCRYPFSRRCRRRTFSHANDEKENETNGSPLVPSQQNKVDEEW